MKSYHVDLTPFLNNSGTCDEHKDCGESSFSVGKSYFPTEHLPKFGELTQWEDVTFIFPTRTNEGFDNVILEEQTIPVKQNSYSTVSIFGASNNGNFFDTVRLFLDDKEVHQFKLKLSDFIAEKSWFDDVPVLNCPFVRNPINDLHHLQPKIYCHHEVLPPNITFNKIKFGENPFIHIFSITLGNVEGGNVE
ncbi:hypothetical protein ACQKJC_18485 [Priestia koreensis]|uniref:hypothetical protein n=1 Tax=Priestia koreensis TaxID=284581 RepID=UPI003D07D49C